MSDFSKTFAVIAGTADVKKLRQIIVNSENQPGGKDHPVAREARKRLEVILGPDGLLADEFETMRRATIEVTGSDCRLSMLRSNRGVIGAVEYLMAQPESGAFQKLVVADRSDETAEAIVLRHPEHFAHAPTVIATAQQRLGKTVAQEANHL